ncbi:MAG: four helix bundle protein [Deltaproteobacteria bacterium]|nr:four helix bundle protein [Deltaproteobacteria bacterium]
MPRNYNQLKVFQMADDLVVRVYQATQHFPREEQFGLTSQIRRAAVSVPANIVEGAARQTEKEFLNFLNISYGSLAEVGYYIGLSRKLGFLSTDIGAELHASYEEISRMLNGLMRSLRQK